MLSIYFGCIILTMINTLSIYDDLKQCLGDEAARKLAALMGKVYEEIAQTVTKKEFIELTNAVKELAEAQKRTEQRLDSLTLKVEELAEAQKRTEIRVEELAEAQKVTERALGQLIRDHSETRKRLESMSDAVGYGLENQSYKSLPQLLLKDIGIELEGKLVRRYFPGKRDGQYIQANIYGWGRKNGDKILILGEAKTSISRREISRFQKLAKRIADIEKYPFDKVCQVIVVHDITPNIEQYAKEKGIRIYWSYEL